MNHNNPSQKIVLNYDYLAIICHGMRLAGRTIGLTIGTWDMIHVGHLRYLFNAARNADILVVGADTDRAVKLYKKNPHRPIVNQEERLEMLSYQSCVDFATLVDDVGEDGKWHYQLLSVVRPDVFIAVEGSYPEEQLRDIRVVAKNVIVLPRQSEKTSTTLLVEKLKRGELVEKQRTPKKSEGKK